MSLPEYFDSATNLKRNSEKTLPPLGMLYIIGNSRHKIDLIDNRVNQYSFDELCEILTKYDIVGFGGTIFEIKEARRASQFLKRQGKVTIYGGPNATINWKYYLEDFTLICRGEAEHILDKIIDCFNGEGDFADLGFSKIQNTYVNSELFRVLDLDTLRYPARDKINLNDYRRQEIAYMGNLFPVDTISSSRGCPFDCYFCSSKIIWDRKYSYRSVDNLIEEMKHMVDKFGSKGFYFREDNFTTKKERLLEFCQKVKELNISWLCESRTDTLNEDSIKLMAESGCKGIWFGLESTDNNVLRAIRKNIKIEEAKTIIGLCNQYGIISGGGFMLGFPFDTKESIINNFKRSRSLGLKVRFYNRVWVIPQSEMYVDVVNEGLDQYSFENIILPATRYLTSKQVNDLYNRTVNRWWRLKFAIFKIVGEKRYKSLRLLLFQWRKFFN